MARKKALTIDVIDVEHLATLDPDGYAYKTYMQYAELSAKHAVLIERLDDPKFEGKDGTIPLKHLDEFKAISRDVSAAGTRMLRAFDQALRTAAMAFHVDEQEVGQIIYDALMANADAMPAIFREMTGPQRGAEFRRIARELVSGIKADKIQVVEESMDVPYCADCLEAIS